MIIIITLLSLSISEDSDLGSNKNDVNMLKQQQVLLSTTITT